MYKVLKERIGKLFNRSDKLVTQEETCRCTSCTKLRKENKRLKRSREGWKSKYLYYKDELKRLEEENRELKRTEVD